MVRGPPKKADERRTIRSSAQVKTTYLYYSTGGKDLW